MVFENSALIIVDPNSKSISTKPCWISHSRSRYSHVAGAKAGGGAKAMEHHKDAHHMPGDRTGQYLVGGLEHVFSIQLGMITSSQLTKSYSSEGWLNHQPDMIACFV